jgi:type 1 glutamine amidotransferase
MVSPSGQDFINDALILDTGDDPDRSTTAVTDLDAYVEDAFKAAAPRSLRHVARRVLYSAIGHHGATYDIPEFQQLISNAITWAGRLSGR